MVAISLYRGNLHRVSDVPRRWLPPSPKISRKNFRILLRRRSSALSLLRRSSSNPNPNPVHEDPKLDPPEVKLEPIEIATVVPKQEDVGDGTDGAGEGSEEPINGSDLLLEAPGIEDKVVVVTDRKSLDEKRPETTDEGVPNDIETRKKEIEKKLEVLNAKKHGLVKVLKNILSAEEEFKRQNSTQGTSICPSITLHVDVSNESGSLSRLTTPRLNSDGTITSDVEKGEADESSPHTTHGHMVRAKTISPSPDSLHRRPAFSTAPHPRASLGGVGSPSRFAPVGHPTNLPTAVSTSGTGYFASSPSPAASGSTSAFRDNPLPSP